VKRKLVCYITIVPLHRRMQYTLSADSREKVIALSLQTLFFPKEQIKNYLNEQEADIKIIQINSVLALFMAIMKVRYKNWCIKVPTLSAKNLLIARLFSSNFGTSFIAPPEQSLLNNPPSRLRSILRLIGANPVRLTTSGVQSAAYFKSLYPKATVTVVQHPQCLVTPINDHILQKKIAFIDDGIWTESDSFLMKDSSPDHNINGYLSAMEKFLFSLEEKLSSTVIIAVSPKGIKPKMVFRQFKCCYESLADVLVYSDLVIAHNSSALNLAIHLEKPIIITYYSEFSNEKKDKIKELEKRFNCKALNIEMENIDNLDIFNCVISTEEIKRYKRDFLSC